MPTFDIVSKTDLQEVDNALGNVRREIGQRFDFKDSNATLERKEAAIEVEAADEPKLKQIQELLRVHFTRRKVDHQALDYGTPEKAGGNRMRQTITIRQGVDRELAKRIVQALKTSKLKIQVAVQGDELRVSGKKIDDLQAAIALVKGLGIEQPLQYVNFRT